MTLAPYDITGRLEYRQQPVLEYTVHILGLSTDDNQNLRLDPGFIPRPSIISNRSHIFRTSLNCLVLYVLLFPFKCRTNSQCSHAQLLEHEKLLLVIDDQKGDIMIYLEPLEGIAGALEQRAFKKKVNRGKIGHTLLVAYDETKRTLALCGSNKVRSCTVKPGIDPGVITFRRWSSTCSYTMNDWPPSNTWVVQLI